MHITNLRLAVTLLLTTTVGCGGSVLIRRDDRTFAESQQRLERARQEVVASGAPQPQINLFMQAEGLYRYRFEPPARSVGNYVVQAIAVATEFAPLQALAASAGMFELRLRLYDGSVHLWETLLDRDPETPLAPLALYRLGWAYRNQNTSGFPRAEPEEAFDELARRFPGHRLVPLALEAKEVAWKSQDTAIGLSIVPGLGQFYAGEPLNGTIRLGVALACAALAVVPILVLYDKWKQDRFFEKENLAWAGTSLFGIILLNVSYTTAYQDAQRAAVEHNERREREFEVRHPESP